MLPVAGSSCPLPVASCNGVLARFVVTSCLVASPSHSWSIRLISVEKGAARHIHQQHTQAAATTGGAVTATAAGL